MKIVLIALSLALIPAGASADNQQSQQDRSGLSTTTDCMWNGGAFSLGAAFCWQPGRQLSCVTAAPPEHPTAWWKDETVAEKCKEAKSP